MRLMGHPVVKVICLCVINFASSATGDEALIEDFSNSPESRWEYFADTVMGGVSQGRVEFLADADNSYLKLVGAVSTSNNGGFIQARTRLISPLDKIFKGLKLRVRGNGEMYFVHIRTSGTRLPWQYYQASFPTTEDWSYINIPFADFEPSGKFMRKSLVAGKIRSIGIVAYGRDHFADLEVETLGLY